MGTRSQTRYERMTSAHTFLQKVEVALRGQEARFNSFLVTAGVASRSPDFSQVYASIATHAGAFAGALLCTAEAGVEVARMWPVPVEPWARELAQGGFAPSRLLADPEASEDLARRLPGSWKLLLAQNVLGIFAPPAPPSGGALHEAGLQEAPLVVEWFAHFLTDTGLGVPPGMDQGVRRLIAQKRLFLWQEGGHPQSMAGLAGRTKRGIRISYVYTPPSLRRRGAALRCVAALTRRCMEQGAAYCALHTAAHDALANRLYLRLGYQRLGEINEWHAVRSTTSGLGAGNP